MRELILFSIDKNNFAIDLDKIKRIVQAEQTTAVAGNARIIEGVFRFEDEIINVLNYRDMIGIPAYDQTLKELFPKLKQGHENWVTNLVDSVDSGVEFKGALNPYECDLGKWLSSFNSYDEKITDILNDIFKIHTEFHAQAKGVLDESHDCKSCAFDMIESEVEPRKEKLLDLIDKLSANANLIANSMQKFLILDAERIFAVRIDDIDDIISIDESSIQLSHEDDNESFVNIDGIFEYKDKLVNLISSISLPPSMARNKG